MALDFPDAPAEGDVFNDWRWDGDRWRKLFTLDIPFDALQADVDSDTDYLLGISSAAVADGKVSLFSVESIRRLPLIIDITEISDGTGNTLNGPLLYNSNGFLEEAPVYFGDNHSRILFLGTDNSFVFEAGDVVAHQTDDTKYAQVAAVGDVNAYDRSIIMGYAGTAAAAKLTTSTITGEQGYLVCPSAVPLSIGTGNRPRVVIDGAGSWGSAYNGIGQINTSSDPNGYFMMPSSAGAPGVTPTAMGNAIAAFIDFGSVATGKLWAYINGTWRYVAFT
jgi:hypothetical protein